MSRDRVASARGQSDPQEITAALHSPQAARRQRCAPDRLTEAQERAPDAAHRVAQLSPMTRTSRLRERPRNFPAGWCRFGVSPPSETALASGSAQQRWGANRRVLSLPVDGRYRTAPPRSSPGSCRFRSGDDASRCGKPRRTGSAAGPGRGGSAGGESPPAARGPDIRWAALPRRLPPIGPAARDRRAGHRALPA